MKTTQDCLLEPDNLVGENIKATVVTLSNKTAIRMYEKFLELRAIGDSRANEVLKKLNSRFGEVVAVEHNIVPTVGLTLLPKVLSGAMASLAEIELEYGAIGNGTASVALNNTVLDNEVYRRPVTSATYVDNKLYATMVYTATDFTTTGVLGNMKEHSFFVNGTTSADSGVMWNRVLLNSPAGVSKTNIQVLTIDYEATFNNA